jgi:hypothetical protein
MCTYRRTNKLDNLITYTPWGDRFMDITDYSLTQPQYDALVALLAEIQTEDFFKLPD